ncbi:MAG: lipocalin family protein [Gemmatimonadaceae bacterium]
MFRVSGMCCALVALLATGCGRDVGVTGPQPFRFGGPLPTNTLIVGTWQRSVVTFDEFGSPQSSDVTWVFNADGSAVRTTVLRNVAGGIADRRDAFARWQLQGNQVIIDFTAPFSGRIQLEFRREGDRLILGGETFVRV